MKKETLISNNVVTVTCSTKRDKVDHDCKFEFDFSNCSDEQKLRLATRSLVIDLQRQIRDAKELQDAKKLLNQKIDVASELEGRKRVRKSTDEKIAGLLKGLSQEQQDALIAAAKAKLAK